MPLFLFPHLIFSESPIKKKRNTSRRTEVHGSILTPSVYYFSYLVKKVGHAVCRPATTIAIVSFFCFQISDLSDSKEATSAYGKGDVWALSETGRFLESDNVVFCRRDNTVPQYQLYVFYMPGTRLHGLRPTEILTVIRSPRVRSRVGRNVAWEQTEAEITHCGKRSIICK